MQYHYQSIWSKILISCFLKYLNRVEFSAFFCDLFGILISGLVDLQEPSGLRQRPQSIHGIRALKVLLLQPLLQVTDVTSMSHQTKKALRLLLFVIYVLNNNHKHPPDLHSFPTGAHVFTEHDVVEGDGTDEEEQLLDNLFDET